MHYVPVMAGSILGTQVTRTEDPELLLGRAMYVSDLALKDPPHLAFVRSEYAHARLVGIDTSEAAKAPGVVGVYTAADLNLPSTHGMAKVHDDFARPPLATGVVRFVGETIAVVVATSATAARDAAGLVVVDYDELPSVVDPEAAMSEGAPVLFEAHGNNVAMAVTDPENPDIFASADLTVRGRYVNQRIAVAAIEPINAAADIEEDGRLRVYAST